MDKYVEAKAKMRRWNPWLIVLIVLLAAAGSFFFYARSYYRADDRAVEYLVGSDKVKVSMIPEGLFLDGPGEGRALIFYPGGKVEYTAYLPLLSALAEGEDGIDCYLAEMPLNLAVFGKNKAEDIREAYTCPEWYIGGHSLGGVVASMYAADHEDLKGVILLAAYPAETIKERTIEIYGSEDRVLNKGRRDNSDRYLPGDAVVEIIKGGNHAQFGDYGEQKGDGKALISREEQQEETVRLIRNWLDTVKNENTASKNTFIAERRNGDEEEAAENEG